MSILNKQVSITVETILQLSRRTVCRQRRDDRQTHLDTLRVHLIILVGLGPVQSGVPLLADQQIREVDLLEFQLDWFDEF